MDYQTAEERAREYREAMGSELGGLFDKLWTHCTWVHTKWHEFGVLYATSVERVRILNEAAGSFFAVVQDALSESVILHICRITDRTESVGKANVTIQRLPSLVAPEIGEHIEALVRDAIERSSFARDWRNRRLAHTDLKLALGESDAAPLAPANKRNIDAALVAIVAVLNAVESHYRNATTAYRPSRHVHGAESLLYVLRDGLEAEARRRERELSGQLAPEDLKSRPPI